MKKIKHDKELEKLAKKLMQMPFNKNGADKSYVGNAIFYFNDYFNKVRKCANN
ncbi:MAG: hypothetical protein Q7K21_02565 [Elusimicrobiota bacterium]|nr:hypothetical protein [Elusimicrobiota bacterium]